MQKRTYCFLSVLGVLLLTGCSSVSVNHRYEDMAHGVDSVPAWVYAPDDYCEARSLICASSQAMDEKRADENAMVALAGVFETKVDTQLTRTLSYSSDKYSEGTTSEGLEEFIQLNVTQMLKGVEIIKRSRANDKFYSLAAISKLKLRTLLVDEINNLDQQLLNLYQEGIPGHMYKAREIYLKRLALNQKLIIVQKQGLPEVVTQVQLANLVLSDSPRKKVQLIIMDDQQQGLREILTEMLYEQGMEVIGVKSEEGPYYFLEVKINSEENYLNVKGFTRYLYQFDLTSMRDNKKIGHLHLEKIANGRNQQNAYDKVRGYFVGQMKKEFGKLNLK